MTDGNAMSEEIVAEMLKSGLDAEYRLASITRAIKVWGSSMLERGAETMEAEDREKALIELVNNILDVLESE